MDRALRAGVISAAQHDAIRRGLGEPPLTDLADPRAAGCSPERIALADAAAREAWALAAQQLVEEAAQRSVEELGRSARMIRDQLDPDGAEARFRARYEARSYRMYRDRDGRLNAHIVFDDEGGAWTESAFDSYMRPRRGGVRFVDPDEKKRAEEIAADPRTNDQLAYDLFLDLLRAGTLAEAKAVFGARQAGVRVVTVVDSGTAHLEETGDSVPATFAGLQACTVGSIGLTITENGDPLRLGRTERLFSPSQRLALAIRDGGCRWRGCDRPASHCEAHHIDPHSEGGSTDIERGILLCRFHHMNLHHGGWRIRREGLGDFLLHPPGGGTPIVLKPRLALKYAWGGIAPPSPRLLHAA